MIYTVTFNPALDYVVGVEHFITGGVNRAVYEELFYGGKGINVSAVLKELGCPSTALGFVAGFIGDEIERGVKALGLGNELIHVKNGISRINVKLKSDEETEINGAGPEITDEDVERLIDKLSRMEAGDILVLSGSIPPSVDNCIYERIMGRLEQKGVKVVVDAAKELLLNVLKYRPFLIKPNNHELGELFNMELDTEEEIISCAKKLQKAGAVNVLVSMAGRGAVLLAEDQEVYRIGVPEGEVKNSVGAGDSMVAGFLAGYIEKRDYSYALKLGAASGSATAFSEGLAKREEIIRLLEKI